MLIFYNLIFYLYLLVVIKVYKIGFLIMKIFNIGNGNILYFLVYKRVIKLRIF